MSKSAVFPPIAVFVDGKVTTFLQDMPLRDRNWSSSFIGSTKHFIQVLKNGGSPIYSGEDGMEITRYAMAAHISAQENRDVHLDEITMEAEQKGLFQIKTNFCNLGFESRVKVDGHVPSRKRVSVLAEATADKE